MARSNLGMRRAIAHVTLVVADYDEAIRFYVDILGFRLIADEPVPDENKRWVVVSPGDGSTSLVLGRVRNDRQAARIGDHALYTSRGARFVREPLDAPYGRIAIFEDLYGNMWDLVEWRRP